MKGYVKDVLAASVAIQYMEITGGIPFKVVRGLSKIRSAIAEEAQIVNKEQERLLGEYNGKVLQNGNVSFPDVQKRKDFETAWGEVLDSEVEIDLDRLDLSALADNIIFHNSNVDVDALSTFIDFDGEK